MVQVFSLGKRVIFVMSAFLLSQAAVSQNSYFPMTGSYRPADSQGNSSGFRTNAPGAIQAPSQQETWSAAQSYGTQNYTSAYPGQAAPYTPYGASGRYPGNDRFNRSFSVNPGNLMDDMFRYGSHRDYNLPAYDIRPNGYYSPYSYPGYGQIYADPYSSTVQQPPADLPAYPSQQPQKQAAPHRPLSRRLGQEHNPYVNRSASPRYDSRFRPPDLIGTP